MTKTKSTLYAHGVGDGLWKYHHVTIHLGTSGKTLCGKIVPNNNQDWWTENKTISRFTDLPIHRTYPGDDVACRACLRVFNGARYWSRLENPNERN